MAMFLLRADGFLASIRRVRHQNGQGVDSRFERGHIHRWIREIRITVDPVVGRVQLL